MLFGIVWLAAPWLVQAIWAAGTVVVAVGASVIAATRTCEDTEKSLKKEAEAREKKLKEELSLEALKWLQVEGPGLLQQVLPALQQHAEPYMRHAEAKVRQLDEATAQIERLQQELAEIKQKNDAACQMVEEDRRYMGREVRNRESAVAVLAEKVRVLQETLAQSAPKGKGKSVPTLPLSSEAAQPSV